MGSDLTERHYNKQLGPLVQFTTYVSSMTVNQVYQSHLAVILHRLQLCSLKSEVTKI